MVFQLRGLPVRPERGQGQTHTRSLADLTRQDIVNPVRSGVQSPLRSTSHETHTVALEEQLEGTGITRKGYTRPQVAPPPLKVVAGGKQCASRSTITPSKTCSADIYRHIKRRVGCSLKRTHCMGNLAVTGSFKPTSSGCLKLVIDFLRCVCVGGGILSSIK